MHAPLTNHGTLFKANKPDLLCFLLELVVKHNASLDVADKPVADPLPIIHRHQRKHRCYYQRLEMNLQHVSQQGNAHRKHAVGETRQRLYGGTMILALIHRPVALPVSRTPLHTEVAIRIPLHRLQGRASMVRVLWCLTNHRLRMSL